MGVADNSDGRLIEVLRSNARELPAEATEISSILCRYADEISAPASREVSLRKLDEFAWHHKGLKDLIVPGLSAEDWKRRVNLISREARAAVRARERYSWWKRLFR